MARSGQSALEAQGGAVLGVAWPFHFGSASSLFGLLSILNGHFRLLQPHP